jgi:hypothetical protein
MTLLIPSILRLNQWPTDARIFYRFLLDFEYQDKYVRMDRTMQSAKSKQVIVNSLTA